MKGQSIPVSRWLSSHLLVIHLFKGADDCRISIWPSKGPGIIKAIQSSRFEPFRRRFVFLLYAGLNNHLVTLEKRAMRKTTACQKNLTGLQMIK